VGSSVPGSKKIKVFSFFFNDGMQIQKGCMKWSPDETNDKNVCCDICHPGNRLVEECGPSPEALCTPCKARKFTVKPKDPECSQCTQCVGAQVLLKECTPTSDTVCGCKEGLVCGNALCSFCVTACSKGQEPSEDGVCRTCPNGTFNDQMHHKCKPWS
uniref:Tumor necrosis factor receptor superfamily, member 9a n=1 Tax=Tetraodon nigroviridis TaxID=99883 RepID=H3D4S4_TETNG